MRWRWSTACSQPSRLAVWRFWPANSVCRQAPAETFMHLVTGPNWVCTALYPQTCRPYGRVFSMSNSLLQFEQGVSVSQFFQVHPENPQLRLIKQAVEIIRRSEERRV